ncbi:MAG TPA: calcium-binding protein [Sphingomicrobium sp.]|nr:calcium-binding protein [Sphingomicrobium sp.]
MPTITGTSGNDTLIGTSGDDLIEGLDGNDTLIGRGGNDTTDGGPGDDVHVVEDAGDIVIEDAGEGNDTVVSRVSYTLGAGVSVETMTTIDAAGTQAINLTGNGLAQSIYGNAGNNILDGGGGADYLAGLSGNDTYLINDPLVRIAEAPGDGDDEVITSVSYGLIAGAWVETLRTNDAASTAALTLIGNEIPNSIYGNAGDNMINGGGGNDYLVGLEGNDYIIGGGGTDVMLGGAGNDTYTIDLAVGDTVRVEGGDFPTSGTILDLGDGENILVRVNTGGGNFQDQILSISRLFALDSIFESSNEGNDVVLAHTSYAVSATDQVEVLVAAEGTADIALRGPRFRPISIYGNDGDNILSGGDGNDYLVGSGGSDTLRGSFGEDTLLGGDGDDMLDGGDSDDILFGGSGNDTLIGGNNNNILVGGTGDDNYVVRSRFDQITELAGEGFDRVEVQTPFYALAAGISIEVLTAPSFAGGPISISGNELDQTIIGSSGDDQLRSGGGADTLIGGFGNDTYYISDGRETIVELANGQGFADTLYTSTDYVLNAGAQVEILSTVWQYGDEDIDITGNEFGGGQRLIGNFGSNVLDGKGGADTLIGLGGADTFAFTTALGGDNVDTIVDFESGIDTIALDDAIFTALPPGDLDPEAFATGTAASEADDRIIYDPATGNLFYDADGSGAGAAVLFAHLNNAPTVAATDFSVI